MSSKFNCSNCHCHACSWIDGEYKLFKDINGFRYLILMMQDYIWIHFILIPITCIIVSSLVTYELMKDKLENYYAELNKVCDSGLSDPYIKNKGNLIREYGFILSAEDYYKIYNWENKVKIGCYTNYYKIINGGRYPIDKSEWESR